MRANDLRLGNILRDKISKTELKVIELTEKNIGAYVIDRSKFPLKEGWELEPIPLTEEILLKCGFEKDKDNWFSIKYITDCDYYLEQMCISINLQSKRLALMDSTEHELVSVEETTYPFYTKKGIYYLHQLQNLYWCLCGEELTVNL